MLFQWFRVSLLHSCKKSRSLGGGGGILNSPGYFFSWEPEMDVLKMLSLWMGECWEYCKQLTRPVSATCTCREARDQVKWKEIAQRITMTACRIIGLWSVNSTTVGVCGNGIPNESTASRRWGKVLCQQLSWKAQLQNWCFTGAVCVKGCCRVSSSNAFSTVPCWTSFLPYADGKRHSR